jgi:hypothetical protein
MTQILSSKQPAAEREQENENDVSTSSYNPPRTEDYRKMFAKTPAGRQEQQNDGASTSDLGAITPSQAYFNKKTTYAAVKSTAESAHVKHRAM